MERVGSLTLDEFVEKVRETGVDFNPFKLKLFLRQYCSLALQVEAEGGQLQEELRSFVLDRKGRYVLELARALVEEEEDLTFPESEEDIRRELEEDYREGWLLNQFGSYNVWFDYSVRGFDFKYKGLNFNQFCIRLSDLLVDFDKEALRYYLDSYVECVFELERPEEHERGFLREFVQEQICTEIYEDFWDSGELTFYDFFRENQETDDHVDFECDKPLICKCVEEDYQHKSQLKKHGSYLSWMRHENQDQEE